ncbi:MAG: OadG family protein, partial [Clostridia bacterium]|nr:OadG family protein [Clostridia bacterium]
MTAALAYFVKYEGTFGGNAREAGQVALLGMAMIFGVLAVLWGVIELLHVLLGRPKKAPEPDPLPKASPAEEAEQEPKEDEGAVIAAITAAIA